MDKIIEPVRRNILLKLQVMVDMYDSMTKPLSASESISQVSTEGYIAVAILALEQQAEIDRMNKLVSEIREACDYTNAAENIKSLIIRHKEKE